MCIMCQNILYVLNIIYIILDKLPCFFKLKNLKCATPCCMPCIISPWDEAIIIIVEHVQNDIFLCLFLTFLLLFILICSRIMNMDCITILFFTCKYDTISYIHFIFFSFIYFYLKYNSYKFNYRYNIIEILNLFPLANYSSAICVSFC